MESTDTPEIQNDEPTKHRGFLLTAFLILMFIANPITAYTYFSSPELIMQTYPRASIPLIYFLGAMTVFNIVVAVAIWQWKKWGIYAFYGIIAVAFVLNLYIGIGLTRSFVGLIGALIIFLTTRNKMNFFS